MQNTLKFFIQKMSIKRREPFLKESSHGKIKKLNFLILMEKCSYKSIKNLSLKSMKSMLSVTNLQFLLILKFQSKTLLREESLFPLLMGQAYQIQQLHHQTSPIKNHL